MSDTLKDAIAGALGRLGIFVSADEVVVEHTADFAHGDYASSVALVYAKQLGLSPRALAEKLVELLGEREGISSISIAGPGFINFTIAPSYLFEQLQSGREQGDAWGSSQVRAGSRVMVEYTQPNPFKPFHIGHLMSNAIGESLSRLIAFAGAEVVRANYQGDVGPHVAKAIWGMQKTGGNVHSADDWGKAYAHGAGIYEENAEAKAEMDALNKVIYEKSDPAINEIYDAGRATSLAHFEDLYKILGSKFDQYFFESETAPRGLKLVQDNPEVFPESDGARVFRGEEEGLHTRVFVTKQGLPTYEAKDLGLAQLKQELYADCNPFIYVTAVEQREYFQVMKAAVTRIAPEIGIKIKHVYHGMMRFAEGKMSSRKGNVITGESLIEDLIEVARERAGESRADDVGVLAEVLAVAAIKFQILRGGTSKDIVFDRERALSVEGDSGPYLQYAHARTQAILTKASEAGVKGVFDAQIDAAELSRLVFRFHEVVRRAERELEPHHVATYLIAVASAFNAWYAQEQILDGTDAAAHKVALTDIVRQTLKNGLHLLGIPAPLKV